MSYIAPTYHFQCWDGLNLLTFSSCSPSAVSLTAYHLSICNVSNLQGQCLIYSIEFVTGNEVGNCVVYFMMPKFVLE